LRWIAVVGGAALLVRLRLLSADTSVTPGDGPIYFQLAHSLLDGNGLAGNDYRTPGYPVAIVPALLAGRVLGQGEAELVLGGQNLLGIALALAVLLVGARHFGWRVGVPAGLLVAIAPVLLPIERMTYPDLLYACGLFAGAALLAEGAVRGGDWRWLAGSGAVFGLSAYVKPAAQPLILVPLLALLVSTRAWRPAVRGGAVAGFTMLLTIAPWLIHNAVDGRVGMNQQGGLTLFYRAFDDDGLKIPTDVRYGRVMRDVQEEGPSVAHHRYWSRVLLQLSRRGLKQDEAFDVMGDAARTAIRRHPGRYLVRTADDVRRTVGDLGATSPGEFEGFDYHAYLHDQLRAARVGVPPEAVAWGLVLVGLGLGVAWLVVTAYGLVALALPFAADERVRAAGCAFLVTWVVAAVTTALGHGSLWRYSAGLAPLAWLAGCAGAWLVWPEVARRAGSRRRRSPTPSRR
jgi:4-amino-4-deoxy-L-arabinose transferase-like glycosyltransferase